VLSLRTISGKLIFGLVVLFGLASAVTSLVTAHSLSNSLMSSLDGQLESATSTWLTCANNAYHDSLDGYVAGDSGSGADQNGSVNWGNCSGVGQAPGTFLVV
jgi:hypothetical protein